MAGYETRVHLIAILLAVAAILGIVELVRRRRLGEWQSLSWLATAAAIGVFAADRRIQFILADLVGIDYPLVFIVSSFVFGGLVIVLLESLALTRLQHQNRRLAQSLAILELMLERSEASRSERDDSGRTGPSAGPEGK